VICRNCSTEFGDGDGFCPRCGAERAAGALKREAEAGYGLHAGTILHGDYCISGFFKRGAAPIYTAKSMKSGNPVLIEESGLNCAASADLANMQPQTPLDDEYSATAVSHLSLKERGDLMGNLAHPGFPSLYDHFIEDNNEYLVMEPPSGKTLLQLAAQGAIDHHISLVAVIKLCSFLEGVHNFQYVHLDIVPENIYIADEYVYLFPFTRVQKEGSHGNGYLTTDGFSAPELFLAESRPVDMRSDIYSIGAFIYWLFSGKKIPLGGIDRNTLVTAVNSPSLARIIQSCTSQDPACRFDNVGQIRTLLLKYMSEEIMEIRFDAAGLTDKGMERTDNEDSLCVLELERCYGDDKISCGIYIIADGIGGHAAGEVASRKAVEVISGELVSGLMAAGRDTDFAGLIRDSVICANKAILALSREDRAFSSMGCTVTAALRVGAALFLGHVGDSRGYLIRDGSTLQLTRDHSVVAGLLERGLITAVQAKTDPERGRILRSLGNEDVVEIDQYEDLRKNGLLDLKPGDVLLLCSDGLPDVVTDDEILACIKRGKNSTDICAELVCVANARGGYDNISAIVVRATGDRL
jgi:serine/threonine protein phosphatase PrpC